jgi:hypothetical protein
MREGVRKGIRGESLLRWVVSEVNALLDVAFQALDASLKQGLLVFIDARKHIDCLLGTVGLTFCQSRLEHWRNRAYPKFNGNGEEVAASLLGNCLTTWNAREVNKAGLDKAFFALHGPDDLLGKAVGGQLQP